MRRGERGPDPTGELIKTIEIKNRDGQVVERKEVVSVIRRSIRRFAPLPAPVHVAADRVST